MALPSLSDLIGSTPSTPSNQPQPFVNGQPADWLMDLARKTLQAAMKEG
jgi:hypothetical protein